MVASDAVSVVEFNSDREKFSRLKDDRFIISFISEIQTFMAVLLSSAPLLRVENVTQLVQFVLNTVWNTSHAWLYKEQ